MRLGRFSFVKGLILSNIDVVFFEIGSKPLADCGILPRKPSDIDWFGPIEYVAAALDKFFPSGYSLHSESAGKKVFRCSLGGGKYVMVEVENSDTSENSREIYAKMREEVCGVPEQKKQTFSGVNAVAIPASIDWLLFFKESHKFKKDSAHFLKTLNDIKLLREIGAQMPVSLESALFKERERLTYTNKLPNLNVKSGEFFNPATVQYKYNHDSIHRAVALYGQPAYLFYKYPDKEVLCSEELFEIQPEHIKLAGVYEEACVLALERSMIPFDFKPNPHKSFATALEKVCTSITGGWFREFAYRHYHEVLKVYNTNGRDLYVERFHKALEAGIIEPFRAEAALY